MKPKKTKPPPFVFPPVRPDQPGQDPLQEKEKGKFPIREVQQTKQSPQREQERQQRDAGREQEMGTKPQQSEEHGVH